MTTPSLAARSDVASTEEHMFTIEWALELLDDDASFDPSGYGAPVDLALAIPALPVPFAPSACYEPVAGTHGWRGAHERLSTCASLQSAADSPQRIPRVLLECPSMHRGPMHIAHSHEGMQTRGAAVAALIEKVPDTISREGSLRPDRQMRSSGKRIRLF